MTKMTILPRRRPLRIGYVLKRFPRLSETFILNELLELERQGTEIEIFSLLRPPKEIRHALLSQLKARITYLPSESAVDGLVVRQPGEAGELHKHKLSDLTGDFLFDGAMPGRTGADNASLVLKAAAVALLSKARGLEHLHAHFGSDATTVAMLAGRLSGLTYSFTAHARDIYHTYIDPETDDRMRRAKIAEAAFVATVSDFNRRHLIGVACAIHASKIYRLYNGIDLNRFQPSQAARDSKAILSVGRLIEKKGFADLIEACRLLRLTKTDFHCTIIGEGPLKPQLEAQIADAGLGGCVELAGPRPQEELLTMMQSAGILILPCIVTESGDRDGLPTVLLEALACGLPSISTTVTGVPEIIEHGKTGLLVKPGAPEELAQAIRALLASPEDRERFAAAGRKKAERDFDVGKNAGRLHLLFEDQARHDYSGSRHAHRIRLG
jgi:colanic acid/amylovoran biosynthesis glycosyltransferase